MSKEYIPLFLDFNEQTVDLTDEECGRLVRAIVDYANGDEYASRLIGAEKIAFRFLKGTVDRNQAISEARSKAGSKKASQTPTSENTEPSTESKAEQNATNGNKAEQNASNLLNENENKNENKKKNENKNDDMCSEGKKPSEPPVYRIILNDKSFHGITQSEINHYKELYPAVNVEQELRKICGWCEANPSRRKTKSGVSRFVNAWLAKEQDRGHAQPQNGYQQKGKVVTETLYDQRPNEENGMDDVPEWLKQYRMDHGQGAAV